MNHQQLYAYALGYHQGRVVGKWEYAGWETMNMVEMHAFREGYDRGVSDYCEHDTASDPMDDFNYVGSPIHY